MHLCDFFLLFRVYLEAPKDNTIIVRLLPQSSVQINSLVVHQIAEVERQRRLGVWVC